MSQDTNQANVFPFRTVSVTGGTGTVGSQFLRALLDRFPGVEKITTTCRPGSAMARRIPGSPRMNVLGGCIEDVDLLNALADEGEIVYHLAAWLANLDMPPMTEIYITNGLAAGTLARICAAKGRRMVFTSSHSVYFAGPYEGRIREDGFAFRADFVEWIAAVKGDYYRLMDDLIERRMDFTAAPEAIEEIHWRLPPPFAPKIYDHDAYHIYCLTKLLAESFVLDHDGVVLRLSNVYGPGDESVQAVAEACHRILAADPAVETTINQPFKKLVPAYLGDIIASLIGAGSVQLPEDVPAVFTISSQEHYLREDALLRTVAASLSKIQGTNHTYRIEQLPPEQDAAFTYDLAKMRKHLLHGAEPTPFEQGVARQLAWLIDRDGQ